MFSQAGTGAKKGVEMSKFMICNTHAHTYTAHTYAMTYVLLHKHTQF